MYLRSEFEGRLQAVKQVSRRENRLLAIVSSVLGLAQLGFLAWSRTHLSHPLATALTGGAFLLYIGILGGLVWRMKRRLRDVRPICPNCGAVLNGLSERIASTTGKCDTCRRDVIESEAHSPRTVS
jgi:hypothetical protein